MIDFYVLVALTLAGGVAAFFSGRLSMSSGLAFGLSLASLLRSLSGFIR